MPDYNQIANLGLAVVVAWYVLARLEPAIKELNKTVSLLSIIVAKSTGVDYEQVRRDFRGGSDGQ